MDQPQFPQSCYTTRSAFRKQNTGTVFTFLAGQRRWIPDLCLSYVQISPDASEVKFAYSCCVVNLYGQHLGPIFEDAMSHQLGEVREGGIPDGLPETGLWVTSIEILDPPGSIEDQRLEEYIQRRKQDYSTAGQGGR